MYILELKRWYLAHVKPGESRTDHAHDGSSSHYAQETLDSQSGGSHSCFLSLSNLK